MRLSPQQLRHVDVVPLVHDLASHMLCGGARNAKLYLVLTELISNAVDHGILGLDSRMKSDLRVYKVQAYSRSYFALLEKLPELREAFGLGDKVVIAGKSVAIEIVTDAPELSESDMQKISASF